MTGKVAVVTGASRGIGEAIAAELAASGAQVVLAGPGFDPATAAAQRMREAGRVAFLAGDGASFVTGSSVDVDGGWLAYGGW